MNHGLRRKLALGVACALSAGTAWPGQGPSGITCVSSPEVSWWAGIVDHGYQMPLAAGYEADLSEGTYGNQAQPLLLSSRGDVIWCPQPVRLKVSRDSLRVESDGARVLRQRAGQSLREAFRYASRTCFPPSGKMPDEALFLSPQYNTWIELMYDQNQGDILKYAQGILDHGLPPGVLMVDDNWQVNYGEWDFKPGRFPDARGMIARLHAEGFKVMLWICPFVHTNCAAYGVLERKHLLLRDRSGGPALVGWWNGRGALLDFTSSEAVKWFRSRLDYLRSAYGVDGFKFDAGDSAFYKGLMACEPAAPNTHSELYGRIGLHYPLNEYRAMWKMGGQPLAERLRDKEHSWTDLRKLIPNMLVAGLTGYPFACPDMIGGGEYKSFQAGAVIDQELVARSAQCHALMPMMQFSVAPWRVLDDTHLRAVLEAVKERQKHRDFILDLARQSALTGEPIVRSMEYVFPHQGYERVNDQFLLGDRFLVAPVLQKGASRREVIFPRGAWRGCDGTRHAGPSRESLPVAADELCYFERLDDVR